VIPLKSGDTVFATVYVPAETAPGPHELLLRIYSRETGEEMASHAFTVTVRSKTGFDLELVKAPEYAVAGEVYQSLYRIRNTGNVRLPVMIEVKSNPDLDFVSEIDSLELAPGGARIFAVSVRTDQAYTARVRHVLRVSASGGPAGEKSVSGTVDILPRISGEDRPFRTLPVGLSVVQALRHAEADTYGFLARVEAEGPLSEAGDDSFSALVKFPFDKDGALFNETLEFAASYRRDPFDFFLGDTFFTLSDLTESSIYGPGGRVEYSRDQFFLGCYHVETGATTAALSQSALWYGMGAGDTTDIKLNLLDSVRAGEAGAMDLLTSVEVRKTGGAGPNTVLEVASDAFHGNGKAYFLAFSDARQGLSYTLETVRADPGFAGEKEDLEEYSARINIPLNTNFSISSDMRSQRTSLERRLPASAESLSLGMKWNLARQTGIGVTYLRVEDVDHAAPRSRHTEGYRLTLSHDTGDLHASATMQANSLFDELTTRTESTESYGGSVTCRIDPRQTLKGFTTVSALRGTESRNELAFGVDYSLRLEDETSLQLLYRSSSKDGSYYAGQDTMRASLSHRISEGQFVTLQGTYAPNRSLGRSTNFNLSLGYRASFALPIGLRKVGKVAGVITDFVTGRGVPDVILRIGDRVAVSDLSGRFIMLSVAPGTYAIGVDLSRITEPRIVHGAQPVTVTVESRKTADVELLLVEPGLITGTVKRFLRNMDGAVLEAGGIPDLLVEIIGENRRLLAATDRNGNFRIGGLEPGEWVVTVASSELPDDMYVETDKPYIGLAPGEHENVFLGVYPVKREIKMIDDGTILRSGGDQQDGR